jgi:hypothetical protein
MHVQTFVRNVVESEWRRREGCPRELASREQQNHAGCVHARLDADEALGPRTRGKILVGPAWPHAGHVCCCKCLKINVGA